MFIFQPARTRREGENATFSFSGFFFEVAYNILCISLRPALSHVASSREVSKYSLYANRSCAQLKTEGCFATAREEQNPGIMASCPASGNCMITTIKLYVNGVFDWGPAENH